MRPYLRGIARDVGDRLGPIGGGGHLVPRLPEVLDQQVAHVWLVVDDEHVEGSVDRLWHGDCSTLSRYVTTVVGRSSRNLEPGASPCGCGISYGYNTALFPRHSRFQGRPTSVLSGLYVRSHPALRAHRRRRRRPSGSHRRTPDPRRVHRRAGADGADALDRLEGLCLRRPGHRPQAARRRRPGHPERGDDAVPRSGRRRHDRLRRRRGSGRRDQARRHRLLHQAVAAGAAVARAGGGHQRAAPAPGERRTARAAARSLPLRQRHRPKRARCSRCSRASSWWRR